MSPESVSALLLARWRLALRLRPDLATAEPWYVLEGRRLRSLAAELELPAGTVIDAAAVLSPAVRWESLVDRLPAFARAARDRAPMPSFPGYGRNVRKAFRMLQGSGERPTGPKVSRFARNLAGDPSCVTVDRWAARAAGLPDHGGAPWYRAIEEGYRLAARAAGLPPSTLQAGLWIAIRDGILVRST